MLLLTGALSIAMSSSNEEFETPVDQVVEAEYENSTRNYESQTFSVDYEGWHDVTHSSSDYHYEKNNNRKDHAKYGTKNDPDEVLRSPKRHKRGKTNENDIQHEYKKHSQKHVSEVFHDDSNVIYHAGNHRRLADRTSKPERRRHARKINVYKRKHDDDSIEYGARANKKTVNNKKNSGNRIVKTHANVSIDMLKHLREQSEQDLIQLRNRDNRIKGRFGILHRLKDKIERKDLIDTILGWFRPHTVKPNSRRRFTWWTTTTSIPITTRPPMGWVRASHGLVPLQAFEAGRQKTGKLIYVARAATSGMEGTHPGSLVYGEKMAMIPRKGWTRLQCRYDILIGKPSDYRWIKWRRDITRHVDLVVGGWDKELGPWRKLYICQGNNQDGEFSIGFMDNHAYCEVPNFVWKSATESRGSFALARVYVPKSPKRGKPLEV